MSIIEGSPEIFDIESHWLYEKEKRLNASSYSSGLIKANNILEKIEKTGVKIHTLQEYSSKIFVGARTKRLFTSKKEGLPYLMPIDIFAFLLKPRKWVKEETQDLENWWVPKNIILVSQSGVVGRSLLTNKLFVDKVISQNVIRFFPNEEGKTKIGYLHAYLNSWIGQELLNKDQYGATVKHIEPKHVAAIRFPDIPELEKIINEKILKANQLREQSQEMIFQAEKMFLTELELIDIDEENIEYLDKERKIRAFEINLNNLDLRFDGSYHNLLAQFTLSSLSKGKGEMHELNEFAELFAPPRFKRAYVKDPGIGLPLLQGSHIPQIRPLDIKYIWKKMTDLDSYIIHKNWILVTCSGTIGRISLVSDYWDGWSATNHLLRIIPNEGEINAGYLCTFLQSIYGQSQFQRLIYGGVVDEIGEAGELFNKILILKPHDENIEKRIEKIAYDAYYKRDQANVIEAEAISLLEKTLNNL